jgi:predicted Zn-dependent protease
MSPSCCETSARRSRCRLVAGALAVAMLVGCGTLTIPQEAQLGKEFQREMRGEMLLVRDDAVVGYVRDIGLAVLRASGPQPFDYQFYVIEDETINAFAGPGGVIGIHTGTILKAANVSELAGVIGHEVGHVAKRHVAINYGRARSTNILYQMGVIVASAFGYGGLANLGGGLAAMAVLNTFGRDAEREADTFAIEVLPSAGYDPNGMVTFFETLRREGGPRPPAFLSSHPTTEDRIAETSAQIGALPPRGGLKVDDRGKLEIIQRRIELLTGQRRPDAASQPEFEPL